MGLRELSITHLEDVKALILAIFSQEPWNDSWDEEQLNQYVFELMGNANSAAFGWYEDDEFIGLALGRIKHWHTGTEYWIDEFGILPSWQGQGKGTEFLQEIKKQLVIRNIQAIVLQTDRTVPAYSFYRKRGFSPIENQVFLTVKV